MHLTKALGFAAALILAAVLGGTLIGSAFALDEQTDGDATSEAVYCDTFMDALASELGVTRDSLVAAGQSAATATIDAAVEAGDLTEERATELRERIAEADGTRCGWFGHGFARGFGHGFARGFLGGNLVEAAADALGIESSELIDQLREAESLQSLAEAQGVSYAEVRASVLAAVEADLDAAVGEGLDQERADAVIERITTWLDGGGRLEGLGRGGFGHRFGEGFGPGFGPFHGGSDDTDAEEPGT